jgi:glucosamine--fructose-6-phosphate aminotransferase (isomerizing)
MLIKEELILEDLKLLPNLITKYINEYDYSNIANILKDKEHIFYLGRGIDYYLSMEGSLKLKEISYIHSEAFQAGELKHGSISLIDKDFGVVSVVTDKTISDKTISNLKEVEARGAKIITVGTDELKLFDYHIVIPKINKLLQPLLTIIPLQMLAYEVAKVRECDIDKPKNLAKSVTVE